jgi:nitrite reductase/ring-hydroxylating ferredoxin subunit
MIDSCRDKLSREEALVVSEFLLAAESTGGFYTRELMRRCPHNGPFFDDNDYIVCEPCGKVFESRAGGPVDDPCPDRLSSPEAFVVGKFLRSYCEGENEIRDELGECGELMRRCPHV